MGGTLSDCPAAPMPTVQSGRLEMDSSVDGEAVTSITPLSSHCPSPSLDQPDARASSPLPTSVAAPVQNLHLHPAEALVPLSSDPDPLPPVPIKEALPPTASTAADPLSQHSHQHTPVPSMPKMIFSDLYKSPRSPFSKLLQTSSHSGSDSQEQQQQQQQQQLQQSSLYPHLSGVALAAQLDYGDAELVSQNKAKQKDAVRRFLAANIVNDWSFEWQAQTTATAAAEAAHARQLQAARVTAAKGASADSDSSALASAPNSDSDADSDVDAADSDCESVYSTVSEDPEHFRPRAEWTSDMSDDEKSPRQRPAAASAASRRASHVGSPLLHSSFRFDSPDSVGLVVKASALAHNAKIRRELRSERAWNTGLACFTARRDAWTGARTVRVKPKVTAAAAAAAAASTSPRRSLFRFHSHPKSAPAPAVTTPPTAAVATTATTATATTNTSTTMPLSPVTSNSRHSQRSQNSRHSQLSAGGGGADTVETSPVTSDGGGGGDGGSGAISSMWPLSQVPTQATTSGRSRRSLPCGDHQAAGHHRHQHRHRHRHPQSEYAVETLLPVARPLLPAANPMRASITPNLYLSLYDKVVLSSLQPSCPINLGDAVRACVEGWKRDGEWPPRPSEVVSSSAAAAAAAAARKNQRREEAAARKIKEKKKERRNSSGLPSPSFGRRMSNLLGGGRPAAASLSTAMATGGGGGGADDAVAAAAASAAAAAATPPASPTTAAAAADAAEDSAGRSIRRSLQRVLGLHQHSHSHSPASSASVPAAGGGGSTAVAKD